MGGWAIAVHGSAGVDPNVPPHRQEATKRYLARCLDIGISALRSKLPAIDVVELVGKALETVPLFNSGRGSAFTVTGKVEMEASIMDGPTRRCGAVSGVTTVKNPISLARLVMEKSPYSHLAFSGAEEFARQQSDYLIPSGTFSAGAAATDSPFGIYAPATVGCVVVDSWGQCAAATSTGGLMNKMTGRIGCTPTIGAGTYACDLCGVSCIGDSEAIIRATLAKEVAAVMEYAGFNLQQAVNFVIEERLDEGFAGLIAVSKNGEVACEFNTKGIFGGEWLVEWATEGGI